MRIRHCPVIFVLTALVVALAAPAEARQVNFFKSARFDQADAKKKDDKKKSGPHFEIKDHPSLVFNKNTHIDFRFRYKTDSTKSDLTLTSTDLENTDAARKSFGIEGEIAGWVNFEMSRALSGDDPWRDVFFNIEKFDFAQFQYGKFKLPFSLDENTGATNLDFAFRSMAANQLAPGRDKGWMVHGRALKKVVRYEYGQFDHDGRNARPKNVIHLDPDTTRVVGGKTTAWRIAFQPFEALKKGTAKDWLSDFHVGWSATSSDIAEGFPGLRARTLLDEKFWDGDFWVEGTQKRKGFELRYRPGPVSFKYETIRATDERRGQSVEDTDLSLFVAEGWYMSATVAVTGEKKADGLDNPKRPLNKRGPGAIEVGFRVEELTFSSENQEGLPSLSPRADHFPGNSDKATTFGINWYPVKFVKLQINFIKETLADPLQGPSPASPSFSSRVVRLQISF